MSYKIKFHKKVFKFLEKCDLKIAEDFYNSLQELWENPHKNNLNIKKLSWKEKKCFRLRIWKFRFKYIIIEEDIIVYFYDAWSRWDVYK